LEYIPFSGFLKVKIFEERKDTKRDGRFYTQGWSIVPLTATGPECAHSSFPSKGRKSGQLQSFTLHHVKPCPEEYGAKGALKYVP
jgi:hypothetical protein